MLARASSIGRPMPASVRARRSSSLAGGWLSSTTACSPCLNEWPALSEAAIVASRSGSWSSNFLVRRRTRTVTAAYGTEAPTARAPRIRIGGEPVTAATSPSRMPEPMLAQTNSGTVSGTAPDTSRRSTERHWLRWPKADSVALKSAARNDRRSLRRCRRSSSSPTCGARRCRTQLPRRARVSANAASSTSAPTTSASTSVPSPV